MAVNTLTGRRNTTEIKKLTLITTKLLDFVHCPDFYKPENTTFRKLDLFPSSGEGGDLLLFWHRLWKGKLLVFL
jgi:hypothetical protein